jgi:hypothetical protein
MLKTQAVVLHHNESYGLHRADTHIFLPWLDVEGRGKMTWTVRLGETRWNEAKKFAFPPEMGIVAQEGHKFDALLAVVRAIINAPFLKRLERGRSTGQC